MKKMFWDINLILVFSVMFCGIFLFQASGGVTEQWIKSYDGKDNDFGQAVAVDSKNNIVAIAQSLNVGSWDCVTIKYDPKGNILWKKIYDSGRNDYGRAIVVDTRDNIIIAGFSYNGKDVDGFIVKYDTNGDSIFAEKYDMGNDDFFVAVTTDSKDGIIVSGYFSNGVDLDCITMKYDHVGRRKWVKTYDGGWGDCIYGVTVDSKDNIFVAGKSTVVDEDLLIIKYDSNGNLLWTKFYNAGRGSNDYAYGISCDLDGNIVMAGYTSSGFAPIKFDSEGTFQWSKPISKLPNEDPISSLNSIEISQDGSIIIGGFSHNGANSDYFVMKYKSNGEMVWFKNYNSEWDDFENGVCIDKENNIIVTGRSFRNGANWDQVIIKYKEE